MQSHVHTLVESLGQPKYSVKKILEFLDRKRFPAVQPVVIFSKILSIFIPKTRYQFFGRSVIHLFVYLVGWFGTIPDKFEGLDA